MPMLRSAAVATLLPWGAQGIKAQAEPADVPSWMTAQEARPWGQELSFDDLEDKASEDQLAKTKELKASALEGIRESMSSNLHRAEMEVDASSALEGFAEPLNETEAAEIADAWLTVPGADVTFSYNTHCDPVAGCRSSGHKWGQPSFQEMHRNMLASLRAMRFCFSDVLVILDVPHVGHDKLGPETPGNVTSHMVTPKEVPGSFSEMRLAAGQTVKRFSVDSGLSTAATATAKAAAELLRDHCPAAAPQWKVKVMDYGSQELRQRALEHYAIADGEKNSSFYDNMYINTMALDENFQAKSQYVYHMDAQWRLYRSNFSRSTPNFIEKALSLMKSDSRVYMASVMNTFNLEPQKNPYNKFAVIPGSVHGSTPIERVKGMLQGWSKDQWLSQKRPLRGEAFHGKWEDPEANQKIALFKMNWEKWGGIVTRHQFLMDTQRFKSLFPLEEWDTAAEHMWSSNMNKKAPDSAFQIYFNETVGIFAGPSES